MTTKELLIASRKRIARGWTQGENARDANNDFINPRSPDAISFCAVGALRAEVPSGPELTASAALIAELPERNTSLFLFNDRSWTTQDDVLALYSRAIARL
jgi:hypothetical protein